MWHKCFSFTAVLLFLTASVSLHAQQPQGSPRQKTSTWKYTFSKTTLKAGDEVDLIFSGTVAEGWYMYATDMSATLGPVVPTFTFNPHKSYKLVGEPKSVHSKHMHDEIWGGEVAKFIKTFEMRQTVKILAANPVIKGEVEYQTCNEGTCIMFTETFDFKGLEVTGAAATPAGQEAVVQTTPAENSTDTSSKNTSATTERIDTASTAAANKPCDKANMSMPKIAYEGGAQAGQESLWGFMILAFIYGLGALLTPCVFPMIPMTVTFFTKHQKGGRFKAMMYGVFIILIYTIAGSLVSTLTGPDFANALSTHWIPNLLFFAIFMVFGFSFLGAFEIVLPSSFVNKVNQNTGKGGLGGVFFMAFTMVLVSFSCTGPLASNVLIESFGGNYLKPIAGMFSFSLAFAIPFTLFAIFPQWLTSLPKSGGWLNSVKVVLGFIEIALAFKFLSVPDTVYHWGLLDRDVYLCVWIVLAVLTGLYLLGKLRFAHDSDLPYITVTRGMLAICAFAFALWLVPGLFGAPLAGLSGYMPPKSTLSIDLNKGEENKFHAKYSDRLHFPHGLSGYFDYCEAIAYAKKSGKPIFIDFTGHGCVNCRKMEEKVWAKNEVLPLLKENYIMLAMYADERLELPEDEWYISPYDQKIKKTLGKQNLDLQARKFNEVAQPYYVLMDAEENLLAPPRAYDEDVQAFVDFLNMGTSNYKRLHP